MRNGLVELLMLETKYDLFYKKKVCEPQPAAGRHTLHEQECPSETTS